MLQCWKFYVAESFLPLVKNGSVWRSNPGNTFFKDFERPRWLRISAPGCRWTRVTSLCLFLIGSRCTIIQTRPLNVVLPGEGKTPSVKPPAHHCYQTQSLSPNPGHMTKLLSYVTIGFKFPSRSHDQESDRVLGSPRDYIFSATSSALTSSSTNSLKSSSISRLSCLLTSSNSVEWWAMMRESLLNKDARLQLRTGVSNLRPASKINRPAASLQIVETAWPA